MKSYRVTFFKLKFEEGEKGKRFATGEERLGSVVVDDVGTGTDLTVTAKAFRQANEGCMIADKVRVEQV